MIHSIAESVFKREKFVIISTIFNLAVFNDLIAGFLELC